MAATRAHRNGALWELKIRSAQSPLARTSLTCDNAQATSTNLFRAFEQRFGGFKVRESLMKVVRSACHGGSPRSAKNCFAPRAILENHGAQNERPTIRKRRQRKPQPRHHSQGCHQGRARDEICTCRARPGGRRGHRFPVAGEILRRHLGRRHHSWIDGAGAGLCQTDKSRPQIFPRSGADFDVAFVILTIVAGTCLFTAAAFRQPRALYELIFNKSVSPVPGPEPHRDSHPPEFVAQFVYRTNMLERTEFMTEPGRWPSDKLDEFLTLSRQAYGIADKTNRAFQVDLAIKNTTRETILLDLNERFFSMADNNGRSAELIYFCCAAKGDTLPPGEERTVQLFFRDAGWHGKSVSASAIYFRVRGFLPVVSASWKSPTLATAAE